MLKTSGETISKQLNAQSRNARLKILQQSSELLQIFAKGKDEIVKFFTKLGDDIGKWFVKNSKTYRKVNNVVNETDLLKFIKVNRVKGEIDVAFVLRISNKRKDLSESLLLSLKEVKEGKTIIQLIRYFKITDPPLPASLGNYQTRIWYTWKKMQIEKQIKRIKKLEEKAKKAFELRNEYRTAARQYMKDRKWANYLEEVEKNREWTIYLEYMKKKFPENYYNEIINNASKGRDDVDRLFNLK